MAFKVRLRKWGSSIGAVLPKGLIEKENLKTNTVVKLEIVREADLSDVFGALKRKMSGQEFKDLVRVGWK